jgi:small-conductance mechanosensitive channel
MNFDINPLTLILTAAPARPAVVTSAGWWVDLWNEPGVRSALWVGGAIIVGATLHAIGYYFLRKAAESRPMLGVFALRLRWPTFILLPLLFVSLTLAAAFPDPDSFLGIERALSVLFAITLTWLVLSLLGGVQDVALSTFSPATVDNVGARRMHTQLRIFSRLAQVIVLICGAAAVLMTFPALRHAGATILTSAGLAGIVLGLAAGPVISNLLAGLQLALTEPIKIGDVLIVESEWGRVEEITSTYVVLKIWDERRLVIPLRYFIEKPFQNWTFTTPDLLGTVFMTVDFSAPLDKLREEAVRVINEQPLWDKRVAGMQVTTLTPQGVEVRFLMSARTASNLWDLRCILREHMMVYLQRNYPEALPRIRTQPHTAEGEPRGLLDGGVNGQQAAAASANNTA